MGKICQHKDFNSSAQSSMDKLQSDQIVRMFVIFGLFFENYRSSPDFRATFSTVKLMCWFWQKMGWAIIWAIFSQTKLVTLANYYVHYNIITYKVEWIKCRIKIKLGLLIVKRWNFVTPIHIYILKYLHMCIGICTLVHFWSKDMFIQFIAAHVFLKGLIFLKQFLIILKQLESALVSSVSVRS
jgi:hypothetical protein